jgi:hypothetical protein
VVVEAGRRRRSHEGRRRRGERRMSCWLLFLERERKTNTFFSQSKLLKRLAM